MTLRSTLSTLALVALLPLAAACDAEPYEDETIADAGPVVADTGYDTGVVEEPYDTDWGTWDTWDTDTDTYLTEDEWGAGYDAYGDWDAWDTDADTWLTEDDWETGFYNAYDYDLDDNELLDETEWNDFVSVWYVDPATAGAFADWDLDADQGLSREELRQGVQKTGLWDRTDADSDGRVSKAEFRASIFDLFDRDDDGRVSQQEFEQGRERLARRAGGQDTANGRKVAPATTP